MTTTITTSPTTTVSVRGDARLDVDADFGSISFSAEAVADTSTTLAGRNGVWRAEIGRVRVRERQRWVEADDRSVDDGFAATLLGSTDVVAAEVGGVVAALVAAEAEVSWVGWSLDDDNPAYREARKLAVGEAHRAAIDFADAVGATLGVLVTLADPGLLDAGGRNPSHGPSPRQPDRCRSRSSSTSIPRCSRFTPASRRASPCSSDVHLGQVRPKDDIRPSSLASVSSS